MHYGEKLAVVSINTLRYKFPIASLLRPSSYQQLSDFNLGLFYA